MKILKLILTGLVALMLLFSASGKLIPGVLSADQMNQMITNLGGASTVMMLGSLEVFIVLLWLVPRTGLLGAFLAIAYMGGATAVHVVEHQPLAILIVLQVIIWTTTALRYPEITNRLLGKKN